MTKSMFRSDYGDNTRMSDDAEQALEEAAEFGLTLGAVAVEKAGEVFQQSAALALITGKRDVYEAIAGGSVPATTFLAVTKAPALAVYGVTCAQSFFAPKAADDSEWTREKAREDAVFHVMQWITAFVDAMTSADIPQRIKDHDTVNLRGENQESCDAFVREVRKEVAAKLGVKFAPQVVNTSATKR